MLFHKENVKDASVASGRQLRTAILWNRLFRSRNTRTGELFQPPSTCRNKSHQRRMRRVVVSDPAPAGRELREKVVIGERGCAAVAARPGGDTLRMSLQR